MLSKNLIRYFIFFLLCSSIGIFLFLSINPVRDDFKIKKIIDEPSAKFSQTTLQEIDKLGNTIWKIKARNIEFKKEKDEIILKDIKGTFFNENKNSIEFSTKLAVVDNKTKNIKFFGEFEGISQDKRLKLRTKDMMWDNTDRRLYSNNKIRFERDNIISYADSFNADVGLNKMKLKNNVKTVIKLR